MNINTEIEEWPISKYIGSFPKGEWKFVKNYQGTYEEAWKEANHLQAADPKTGRKKNHYRIWDQL
jgi:hypothetical protein